ncbi:MAG: histidinol-phosphate transaminase [Actinomycetaceae bacterium]|nr:histidinol-phosphate transaminase [Actinomycetaceae bacterium]
MSTISLPYREEFVNEEPYGAPQIDVPVFLNVNENPYPPSPELIDAIGESVKAVAHNINRYPDRDCMDLRKELAGYLREESHVDIEPSRIWVANGSNEIMMHILTAFAGPERTVVSCVPTYSMYPEYVRNVYARYVTCERHEDFTIDLHELRAVLEENNPSVLLLANPNNPTGTMISADDVRAICDMTSASGPGGSATVCVIDEAYAEFRRDGIPSSLELLEEYPHIVVVRTMSKAFGAAGLRLGYMAASQKIVDQMMVVRLPYHLSALTQAAALAALRHRKPLQKQVAHIRKDRDSMKKRMEDMGCMVVESDANFLLFGTFDNRHDLWQKFLDEGILIREVGPTGFLRVSIGTPEENELFLEVLSRELKGLKK